MNAFRIVIALKLSQFPLKVDRRPKQDMIQELAPDGANQSFDEWMG